MKLAFSVALAAAAICAPQARAACVSVEPTLAPQVRLDPLDAAGPAQAVQPVLLIFRRNGADGGPLTVRYQVVDEDSVVRSRIGVTAGPVVAWQAQDSSRDISAFRSETLPLARTAVVRLDDSDTAAQAPILMRLTDLRDDLPAGVYREQFTVRYWCSEEAEGAPFEARGVIAASVAVPNVLSASIAGASSRGEIDFLDFALPQREVMISVRSTGPFRITTQSDNGGVLVRQAAGARAEPSQQIGYRASLDGGDLGLEGSARTMSRAGLAGRQMALRVTVEDTRSKRAGDYADTLWLTLSPAN